MTQTIEIPGKLPYLNELIAASKQRGKSKKNDRWFGYAALKRTHHRAICAVIRRSSLKPIKSPVSIHFHYHLLALRGDLDGIDSGARKFILDALVDCKILPNDNLTYVKGLSASFEKGVRRKVVLTITEV